MVPGLRSIWTQLICFWICFCWVLGHGLSPGLSPSGIVAHAEASSAEPSVIVLSWDGVRHDYLDRGQLPALERIARDGARADALIPVFPATTFPNHVSLATGAPVDRHGIVGNRFYDRERGDFSYGNDASWIEAEPLWSSAERQGVRAAVFFWVGSETDWRGVGASYRVTPFNGSTGEREKVDQILRWFDMPASERPRLIMSWWRGADHAGHRHGPDSEKTSEQLRAQDGELARLLAALDQREAWDWTTLIIVSDHGMAPVGESIDPLSTLKEAGVRARMINAGGLAHFFLDEPDQLDSALAALEGMDAVRVFRGDALPEHWRYNHPRRIGDLVAVTSPPSVFGDPWSWRAVQKRIDGWLGNASGSHGYDPQTVSEMHGIFLALGRGVSPGAALGRPSVLDLAATVAGLLAIEPPAQSEGKRVPGIGPPS